MINPFEIIEARLNNIENLILDLKHQLTGKDEFTEQPDQFLTTQQTADFLGLPIPTIYGLVSHRKIPHNKVNNRLYFSKQELIDWIKAGRRKTDTEIKAEVEKYLSKRKKGFNDGK